MRRPSQVLESSVRRESAAPRPGGVQASPSMHLPLGRDQMWVPLPTRPSPAPSFLQKPKTRIRGSPLPLRRPHVSPRASPPGLLPWTRHSPCADPARLTSALRTRLWWPLGADENQRDSPRLSEGAGMQPQSSRRPLDQGVFVGSRPSLPSTR